MDRKELICIICPSGCELSVELDREGNIRHFAGANCKRGEKYVKAELLDPVYTSRKAGGVPLRAYRIIERRKT